MRTHLKTRLATALGIFAIALFGVSCGGKDEGASLEEQLIGYWSPDPASFLEMVKGSLPAELQENEEALAEAKKQAEMMAGQMVIHFDGKKTFMYGPGEAETSTYVITSSDPATKTLMSKITNADGSEEDGKAMIDGDSLTLMKVEGDNEEKLDLIRITEEEAKKRVPAIGGK